MRTDGIELCHACHAFLHKQYSEKELGRNLNTLEKIQQDPLMRRYIRFARKQR